MIGLIAAVAGLIFVASMLFISSFFIRSIIEPVGGDHGDGQAHCRRLLRRADPEAL